MSWLFTWALNIKGGSGISVSPIELGYKWSREEQLGCGRNLGSRGQTLSPKIRPTPSNRGAGQEGKWTPIYYSVCLNAADQMHKYWLDRVLAFLLWQICLLRILKYPDTKRCAWLNVSKRFKMTKLLYYCLFFGCCVNGSVILYS